MANRPMNRFNFGSVGGGREIRTDFLEGRIRGLLKRRFDSINKMMRVLDPDKLNALVDEILSQTGTSVFRREVDLGGTGQSLKVKMTRILQGYIKEFGKVAKVAAQDATRTGGAHSLSGQAVGTGVESLQRNFPEVFRRAKGLLPGLGSKTSSVNITEGMDAQGSALTEFNIKSKDAANVTRTLTLTLDKLGNVLTKTQQQARDAAVKAQAEISKQTRAHTGQLRELRSRFPDVTKALYKADPRFVTDPRTQIKTTEDPTTGITRVKASFEQADGAIKQVNLALDKSGRVLRDTSKRFNTFTGSVRRNIGEFFKWSLAVSLIYGPVRKLQELIEIAISNQTKLVDVTITLGKTQGAMNDIFEDAARVATLTGESLNGVIEGYNLAVRATGNITNQTERYATANQLLTDSIILAKLSSLEQSEATDTLTAALIQTGTALDRGQDLLDKWVKVSRIANVDVSTLATSFGMVAESADKAGLSVDTLNGLIAVVAEAGITSPKETGTAVRAIIAGFTTENAVKELRSLGISVEVVGGQTKDFLEVFESIKSAFDTGLISETQLGEIAYKIGGGSRRQAQAITALVQLDRLNEIAMESAKAHGEAQEALDLKLDTVATRVIKLGNSFQVLAQAMGTDGGILDTFSALIDLTSSLVLVISKLTAVMGVAGPVLATLGIARAVTTGGQRATAGRVIANRVAGLGIVDAISNLFSKTKTFAGGSIRRQARELFPGDATYEYGGLVARGPEVRSAYRSDLTKERGGRIAAGSAGRIAGSVMFTGFLAGMQAAKGDIEGAGVIFATGIVSGFATNWGPGSMIATTIASVFVNAMNKAVESARGQTIDLFTGPSEDRGGIGEPGEDPFDILLGAAGQGKFGPSEFVGGMNLWAERASSDISKFFGLPAAELSELEIISALAALQGGMSEQDVVKLLTEMGALNRPLPEVDGGLTPYSSRIDDDIISNLIEEGMIELRKRLYQSTPDISASEFGKRSDALDKLTATLPQFTAPLRLGGVSQENAIQQIYDVFLRGTEEQTEELSKRKGSIEQLSALIDATTAAGETQVKIGETVDGDPLYLAINDAEVKLTGMIADYVRIAEIFQEQANLARATIPTIFTTDISQSDISKVVERAGEYYEAYADQLIKDGKPNEASKFLIEKKGEEFYLEYGDKLFQAISGVDTSTFQQALQDLIDEGLVPKIEDITLSSISELEIEPGQLPDVMARYRELLAGATSAASQAGITFKENKEPQVVQFTNGHLQVVEANWSILMMAINEILETEKSQLEGIYNLPSDGTFFVPWQAAAIRPGADGEGLNNELFDASVDKFATAVNLSAEFMAQLRRYYRTDVGQEVQEGLKQQQLEAIDRMMRGEGPQVPMSRAARQHFERIYGREDEEKQPFTGHDLRGRGIQTPATRSEFDDQLERLFRLQSTRVPGRIPGVPFITSGGGGTNAGGGGLQQEVTSLVNALGSAKSAIVNLNMSLNAKFMVNLDGRVIATAIKRYLHKDLIRGGIGSAVVNKSIIIQV